MEKKYLKEMYVSATPAFVKVKQLYLTDEPQEDTPIPVIRKTLEKHLKTGFKYKHDNIWDFLYELKADEAYIKLTWLEYTDKKSVKHFVRYVELKTKGLALYDNVTEQYESLDYGWGSPDIIKFENNEMTTLMAIPEMTFDSENIFLKDMESPSSECLSVVFDEIFADG